MQVLGKNISIERVIYNDHGLANRWLFLALAAVCALLLVLNVQGEVNLKTLAHQPTSLYQHNIHYLTKIEDTLISDFGQLNTLTTQLNSRVSTPDNNVIWSKDVAVIYQEFVTILTAGSHYALSAVAIVGALQIVNYLSDWLAPVIFNVLLAYMSIWSLLVVLKRELLYQTALLWLGKVLIGVWLCLYLVIPYSIHVSSAMTHEIEAHFHHTLDHDYFTSINHDISQIAHSVEPKNNALMKQGTVTQGATMQVEPMFIPKIAQAQMERGAKVIMTALAHKVISLLLVPLSIGFLLYMVFRRLLRGMARQEVRSTPVCRDPIPLMPLK
ncbi:hypothetical protein CWB96_21315 [Pseudoalteromonas citrea]|uniref:Uncharacterized protein n=1 Tax=Pseudoalteromonas citrea TaxID=43655 RepID=A0A5S3XK57_9GAMM|nr:hypothetical protein [Pseudoalteromonas citrea]TMP40785.1 hypothetical protein CWB97_16855 [Pseudoalteromonas citrea]TMP53428.1 hypothetical protein CWB96_21315 [Pseudoalteromonas citrea]